MWVPRISLTRVQVKLLIAAVRLQRLVKNGIYAVALTILPLQVEADAAKIKAMRVATVIHIPRAIGCEANRVAPLVAAGLEDIRVRNLVGVWEAVPCPSSDGLDREPVVVVVVLGKGLQAGEVGREHH